MSEVTKDVPSIEGIPSTKNNAGLLEQQPLKKNALSASSAPLLPTMPMSSSQRPNMSVQGGSSRCNISRMDTSSFAGGISRLDSSSAVDNSSAYMSSTICSGIRKSKFAQSLKEDDMIFRVTGTAVIQRLEEELNQNYNEKKKKSTNRMMTLPSFPMDFTDAVNYRITKKNSSLLRVLVKRCHQLGLGSYDPDINPLLKDEKQIVANVIEEEPMQAVQSENKRDSNQIPNDIVLETSPTAHPHFPNLERGTNEKDYCGLGLSFSAIMKGDGPPLENNLTRAKSYDSQIKDSQANFNESKARQQIFLEMKDASDLMKQSTNSTTSSFWRKHVLTLRKKFIQMAPKYGEDMHGNYMASMNERKVQESQIRMDLERQQAYVEFEDEFPVDVEKGPVKEAKHMVEVIAPGYMMGGYTFDAILENKRFLAVVPKQGVIKGQVFKATMLELDEYAPRGSWKDNLCCFFSLGICHPLLCNTMFLPHLALSQIMTRAGLDWYGQRGHKYAFNQTCSMVTFIVLFWLVATGLLGFSIFWKWYNDIILPYTEVTALCLVNVIFILYSVHAVTATRLALRIKYDIPQRWYLCGFEDFCCAVCCACCTISQMGRHTADYDAVDAKCCTDTGLTRTIHLERHHSSAC